MGCHVQEDDSLRGSISSSFVAGNGHFEMFKFLVENVCKIKEPIWLDSAAGGGHLKIIKYLIEKGNDINEHSSCITFASKNGHLEVIKYLVEKGCSLQSMNTNGTCIMNAAKFNHF